MPEKSTRNKTFVLIAAIVIIVLIAAGGFIIYTISTPAVWGETLKVKNSTGQYGVVTKYRNSTDTNLLDLKAFLDVENVTLRSMVESDGTFRPVEYAIQLHNDAQIAGINCSVVPLDIVNDTPGHVVVAFNTKDAGMVYVDPGSMNVSGEDYPGIAFDRIIFLRDQWNHTLPVTDEKNSSVIIREYRNAQPVNYSDLLQFLAADETELIIEPAGNNGIENAVRLHNNAEADGLSSAIVQIAFNDSDNVTYMNAFATVDKGIVYVDDSNSSSLELSAIFKPHDDAAYLTVGSRLGELPIDMVDGNMSYAYYQNKSEMIGQYLEEVSELTGKQQALDKEINTKLDLIQVYNDKYTQCQADLEEVHYEKDHYNSLDPYRKYDWPTLISKDKELEQSLNSYRATISSLESDERSLENEQGEINGQLSNLLAREESKWLSYYPALTVEGIEIYW